jgi:hypothetical protein
MATLVQIDESSGTQNSVIAGATTNDIDILSGGIPFPTEFSTALAAVTGGQGLPSVAALTGFGTATTADDFIPVTFGANVSDVAFTLTGGNGVDSTLMTANGTKIFLYVYSGDNNVVLGRVGTAGGVADPNGALAFAGYLDTNATGSGDAGATAARLWLMQFQALKHPDGTNANDVVTLSGLLNVQVTNLVNFSLEGAPSGNNLFLMFGDGTPSTTETTIVVTGQNPANQSGADPNSTADDISITTGDTVNTGQGGGGTTLGNTSQMLNPQKGLIFTYVTGADPNFTVSKNAPNLDQNEADIEANISFTALVPSSGAEFSVVQLQQDSLAELQISAFNTALETGTGYVDGLGDADDVLVAINFIKVSTFTKQGQNLVAGPTHVFTASGADTGAGGTGVTATFNGDGTVKLVGLEANDKIEYHTGNSNGSLTHTRVLIKNTGDPVANASPTNASFDIGGFRVTTGNTAGTPLDALAFVDDGPTASAVLAAGTVAHDETAGLQADANDTTAAGVVALFSGVTTLSTQMTAGYAQGSASVVNSSASAGGADGLAGTVYSLAVSAAGVDSGLDTVGGQDILLFKEGALVVGRISGGADDGEAAFAVAINSSTGVLSMAQYNAIKHPTGGASSPDESLSIANAALLAVVTVTDGDTDTNAASVAIGAAVSFQDDAPAASAVLAAGTVAHDETAGVQADANDTTAAGVVALFAGVTTLSTQMTAGYAQGSAAVVDGSASTGGVDGLAGTSYSLAVSAAGVDSGLDTVGGQDILLFKEGALVVGRISGGADNGKAAFAVAINSSTGVLSMAQYNAIKHPTGGASSPDESLSIANAALLAVTTATDGDTDTNAASVAIGAAVSFQDDGPSLAFGSMVGTGTSNPQYGFWTPAAGVDGLGTAGLDMTLTGFTLVRPNGSTTTGTSTFAELAGSPNGSGSYLFGGSLTGDFDNIAATPNQTVNFTLTAFANGTYQLDLAQGFGSSTSTVSTIDGLTAGGPDPVQTLTPGAGAHPPAPLNDKQIVFFNVLATATETQIENITGADPDLTEAQIEANGAFTSTLGTEAMNVSTAGIGIGNNNLNGNDTSSNGLDESFVANPEFDVTSVKVFIDNSVSGYTPATESLLYKIYYTNGDTSGAPVKVLAGDLVAGAKNNDPVHFVIQATGGRTIDAVQLTMDSGTIKIPFMEFVTVTNNLANDLQLDFLATLTDGDGDTASSAFEANLNANELIGNFNFLLAGTSAADAFNIDLADVKNLYQASAFTPGTDKLVLLGANSFTIDNSGANSIVDITETAGGQHTLVTVVGVDLAATDIATIV